MCKDFKVQFGVLKVKTIEKVYYVEGPSPVQCIVPPVWLELPDSVSNQESLI